MANKNIFSQPRVRNHAGGIAYQKSAEQTLAQFAMTGTFGDTYYVSGKNQLEVVLEKANQVSDEFIAKLAVYGRQKGLMKDMPALLCAILVARQSEFADAVFWKVIDNAKMLRNFVQMMRSGVVGRKSLGSKAKRLVKAFISKMPEYTLWEASVGNSPSLVDILKLAHPKAKDEQRNNLYAYLMGKPADVARLPEFIRDYEAFVVGRTNEAPLRAPFQKLTALPLGEEDWARIATNAQWQMTRMNLNTFARHGVFEQEGMTSLIAERLADREHVLKARAFPFQLMSAMLNIGPEVPDRVQHALEAAMDISLENVPVIAGATVIAVDISGSMRDPISGKNGTATSKVQCVDVAALVGAALLHKNPHAQIVTFNSECSAFNPARNGKVMTMAKAIKAKMCGGTDCGSVMRYLMRENIKAENVLVISDNESWCDRYGTEMSTLWARYKQYAPDARMINLDITPNEYSASADREDTLRVGGFSDEVFSVMEAFLSENKSQIDVINAVSLG
jgi:60 kDa SS-A/Ro ribonucleoprotein